MFHSTWKSYINDMPVSQRWVAATLFALATTKRKQRRIGRRVIELQPGQIFVTRRKLADIANVTRGVVDRAIDCMVSGGTISVEASHGGSIITLLQYEDFRLSNHEPRATDGAIDEATERAINGAMHGAIDGAKQSRNVPELKGNSDPKNKEERSKSIPRDGAVKLPGFAETIEVFDGLYQQHHGGAKPTWGAKQGAQVKALLKAHGAEEVQRRIRVLFSDAPSWIDSRDVGTLVQHFDKLAPRRRVSGASQGDVIPLFRGLSR